MILKEIKLLILSCIWGVGCNFDCAFDFSGMLVTLMSDIYNQFKFEMHSLQILSNFRHYPTVPK